jgi:hypothetical protein
MGLPYQLSSNSTQTDSSPLACNVALKQDNVLAWPFPFEARVQHEGRLKLALMNGGDEAAEVADTLRHDGLNGAAIVAFQSIEEERTMGERGARMEGLVSIRLTSVYKRTSCGDWQEGEDAGGRGRSNGWKTELMSTQRGA